MRVSVLQHVAFEGIGSMESWFSARDADIHYTRFFEATALPDLNTIDLVIAMGGPMSVNDEAQYPWLIEEKAFIREAIQRGVAVIGICLGAQLIASALGAKVYANREKEIGWFPIEAVVSAATNFQFPAIQNFFHWHGETFDLPAGATRIAKSAGCDNQTFQIGSNVIGLQFHPEATPAIADLILQHCRSGLVDARYIQPEHLIRSEPQGSYLAINNLMEDILAYVTATKSA
ncbi:MAG: glutamine amidotransferase class-I [Verrucomicrobiaceae bacterium]|nr:glutamine amidotransferase class-I [Verrucomicrobiaceae bacterium]